MNFIFAIHTLCFHTLPACFGLIQAIAITMVPPTGHNGSCCRPCSAIRSWPNANSADSAHHRAAGTHRHHSKYMFNSATYSCPTSISLLFSCCQFFMPASFTLNMFPKSLFLQLVQRFLRTIGRISPDIFAGIARIKQFGKYLAVMDARISHVVAANKFVPDINADVVLITKERFTVLFVQRASVSFCRRFALDQDDMDLPSLISLFSSRVLRWVGTRTILASTIWPFWARKPLAWRNWSNLVNRKSMTWPLPVHCGTGRWWLRRVPLLPGGYLEILRKSTGQNLVLHGLVREVVE